MKIRFTISKRGLLASEADAHDLKNLLPRLDQGTTIDAVEFYKEKPWGSVLKHGDLAHALTELRRIIVHEMEKGNAVQLPGIGTFRLSLKGDIEVQDNVYRGRNVHVDDILFQPDRDLRDEVRTFAVDQVPYGTLLDVREANVDERLTALFAEHDTITHKDVAYAFELTMSHHRISSLLKRLTSEGRLLREGEGSQTRYRAAEGQFGR